MIKRTTKLRWRRRIRTQRRQVEDISAQADATLERHFFRRLNKLSDVRRFVFTWIVLLVLLIGCVVAQTFQLSKYYEKTGPVAGGIFTEGITGAYTNANPIYATGPVDLSVSRLIFNGLFRFDSYNRLVSDLAEKYTIDEKELVYTVTLRNNVKWHDGKPFTADDVVFTYTSIQNPDAKSPLFSSWQGVTVAAKDSKTVTFTLPNALSSFPYSLTNGITPKHILGKVPIAQLRSTRFNTIEPVGTGPFTFSTIDVKGDTQEDREEQISLEPNDAFYRGAPKLSRYVIRTFRSDKKMIDSFSKNELTAIAGIESLPDNYKNASTVKESSPPYTAAVMAFFKTSDGVLKDQKIRQALVQATNRTDIIKSLQYPTIAVNGPLLNSHIGYNKDIQQLAFNVEQAKKTLDEAGWVVGKDGIRAKGDAKLTFRLVSQSTPEYAQVAQLLQKQWREIGVSVEIITKNADDMQVIIAQHSYDALLYGISLGIDPDVFAFWHSTQAAPRAGSWLNFSEYKSTVADKALEAGRTRSDPKVRAVKYKPFLEAWRSDAPAVAIYQPNFYFASNTTIYGLNLTSVNNVTDRYANVENWMIIESKVPM